MVSGILSKMLIHALLKEDLKSLQGGKLLYMASIVYFDFLEEEESTEMQIELTKILLNFGADPNDNYGNNAPLIEACNQMNIGLAKLLLDSGANVNVTNYSGDSILHLLFTELSDEGKIK